MNSVTDLGARGADCADAQLPAHGALLVIAEGALHEQARQHVIARLQQARPDLVVVSAMPKRPATSLSLLKQALKHLRSGGCLLLPNPEHPAEWKLESGKLRRLWHPLVGALARLSRAPVLTVSAHSGFSVELGKLIPAKRLQKVEDPRALTEFIRSRALLQRVKQPVLPPLRIASEVAQVPIVEARPLPLRVREIQQLRESGCCFASQGALSVFVARAQQMPHLLHEIGRQREITFRQAGEGTGRQIDLDHFDQHYLHLFLWDEAQRRIAGAYRLGCADELLRAYGARGLYTHSLFRFGRTFLSHLHDAVELGRSFITADYQRDAVAMPLLWKGIVSWLAKNPRYRKLFGPVSISRDYAPQSRRLMVRYLRKHHQDPALSRHVQPRRPYFGLGISPAEKSFLHCGVLDAEDCSEVVSGFEADGKGFPTLLRHYLKLNGRFLSFNVDPDFSDVLDGLVMVDMLRTDPRLPARLMGRGNWQNYLAHHQHALAQENPRTRLALDARAD
jgi:hypothetical protein